MAMDKKVVWEDVTEEFYANAKWSVSSIVVPTRHPATNEEDIAPPAKPSHDEPE